MTFATETAATALELLAEFGKSITLTRAVPGAYNVTTGATAAATTATYTGTGYAFEYEQRDIDGSQIRVGDQRVLLATSGVVQPQTGDTMTIGGTVYAVVRSKRYVVEGSAVLYDCQVRGVG